MAATVKTGMKDTETRGSGKLTPPHEISDDSSSAMLTRSEKGLELSPTSAWTHASSASTIRDSNNGMIPIALLLSQSASFGKVPTKNTAGPTNETVDGKADYPSAMKYETGGTASSESNSLDRRHASLVPKPLAVGQSGKTGRQKAKEQTTESGWWGALASVIYRPQAEYDPSNVV